MLPFVASKDNESSTAVHDDYNFEIGILVMAKKVGLSFDELDTMTMQDFMDFIDIYVGEDKEKPRQATQEDIDRFFG